MMNEQRSQPDAGLRGGDALGRQALEMVDQLQGQLNELRDQLACANRLGQLGLLSAALAHEMNNLLTPIRSYAQLALARPSDRELTDRALQSAISGTDKAERLTEMIMGLASPREAESGAVCAIDTVVADAVTCLWPMLRQQGVEVLSKIESVEVAIDALSLEQVLVNLMTNACQAMAESNERRTIRIASGPCDAASAILLVSDTGPGVDDAIRDQVFEPFVSGKGRGLGLHICKQLIETAGGAITLTQSNDRGATFEIRLPRRS